MFLRIWWMVMFCGDEVNGEQTLWGSHVSIRTYSTIVYLPQEWCSLSGPSNNYTHKLAINIGYPSSQRSHNSMGFFFCLFLFLNAIYLWSTRGKKAKSQIKVFLFQEDVPGSLFVLYILSPTATPAGFSQFLWHEMNLGCSFHPCKIFQPLDPSLDSVRAGLVLTGL